MDIFNDFLISMKNIKTFLKETLNKDKNLKSNSFVNNIDEIILYLKLNERKIKNREDISNSLFLKTINTNIKVLDIYNYLPEYIKEFILKSKDNGLISENDENILETFKNNILNVKLELFLNIENNLKEFKVFENKILNIFDKMIKLNLNDNVKSFDIDSNKENKAKFLALSFYFYKIDKNLHNKNIKDKDIKDNINNKDNFIEINDIDENYLVSLIEKTISNISNIDNNIFSNNFLPSNNELEMLKLNDVNFNTGLEYEFWLKNELFNIKDNIDQRNNIAFQRINEFFKLINLNSNPNIDGKNKNLKAKYETISEIKEETVPLNTYSNANKQYLEIISKKFNSISEMLVFHGFILKFINQIKIENNNEISFSRFKTEDIKNNINGSNENKNLSYDEIYEKAEEKLLKEKQNKIYNEFPGSLHFNISIPNIENMNKLKFYLFLKDSNLMDKWEIRNDNVKDINLLINIFGPHIINSKELDKLWQINFSYLNNLDKSGNINPRLEIRYMGGKDYHNRINDINENFLKIMECVKISMCKDLKIDEYKNFVNQSKVGKEWDDLNDDEIKLCFKFFKTNDIKIAKEKFKEIKIELDEIKKRYTNGFNR